MGRVGGRVGILNLDDLRALLGSETHDEYVQFEKQLLNQRVPATLAARICGRHINFIGRYVGIFLLAVNIMAYRSQSPAYCQCLPIYALAFATVGNSGVNLCGEGTPSPDTRVSIVRPPRDLKILLTVAFSEWTECGEDVVGGCPKMAGVMPRALRSLQHLAIAVSQTRLS